MSKIRDDQWPVRVFRYSHDKGWELFQQATTSGTEKLTAAPRRNCVEIKHLRLRIHILRPPPTISSDQQDQRKKSSHTASVIRRRDTLLLSKGDFGAVVLKFESIADCTAFTDRLVELNRDEAYMMNQDKEVQRSKFDMESVLDHYRSQRQNSQETEQAEETSIQSHLIALLHDREFLGFVERIEECLKTNDDCIKMLKAHEHHPFK
mmetsp:Transcript_16531/g.31317  ORF Transcript_16531/g.31317 Transcript_16531/m.31317 type:complete len:207 (-) Transcript_16531:1322-1942(-)